MGICCTGKISKTEYRSEEIIRNQRHTPQTGISAKIEPTLSFDINNSPLNTNINLLISECQNSNYNFKVSKINFDLLWNIVIEYKYDYTSCNYIIKDFLMTKILVIYNSRLSDHGKVFNRQSFYLPFSYLVQAGTSWKD